MAFTVLPNTFRGMHIVSDDGHTLAGAGANVQFADLIADAFNTAHETGRTPSELAALVDRVRGIVADWNCCEDEPRASAFRLHDALIDALLADLDAKTKEG